MRLLKWLVLLIAGVRLLFGAWDPPTPETTSTLIVATDWNRLVNDILYLFGRPYDVHNTNEGANYTTTSTTFTPVDGTDLARSVSLNAEVAWVHFHGTVSFSATNQSIIFDVTVDGVSISGDTGVAVARSSASDSTGFEQVSFDRLVTGLSDDTHTFTLQWRTSTGTGTLYARAGTSNLNVAATFFIMEVSND